MTLFVCDFFPITPADSHDKARLFELQTGQLGHTAIPYDMTFVPQKATKGHALVDFLEAHPVLETLKLHEDIPDKVIKANMSSEDEVW